jgi:hypothetical protein
MEPSGNQLSFETYESEVINPLRGHKLTPMEEYISSLLLDTSKQKPITNEDIRARVKMRFNLKKLDPRTIKNVIRSLRKFHHFPILASFTKPYGYWWCQSAEQMVEYYNDARGRLLDEFHTLSVILRVNFPDYAGQLKLEEGDANE